MRALALVLSLLFSSSALQAQPVLSLQGLGLEAAVLAQLSDSLIALQGAPVVVVQGSEALQSLEVVGLDGRARRLGDRRAEAPVWAAVLVGGVLLGAAGWYLVGAGLSVEGETPAHELSRTMALSLGIPLAVAGTGGAVYAGHRLVVILR